jgi:hypothetical protein
MVKQMAGPDLRWQVLLKWLLLLQDWHSGMGKNMAVTTCSGHTMTVLSIIQKADTSILHGHLAGQRVGWPLRTIVCSSP